VIIDILTLFPAMFSGPFSESIIKRAIDRGLVKINLINIRDFGIGKHKVVDDKPYGGGVGMVMRVDVVVKAIESVVADFSPRQSKRRLKPAKTKIVLLDPKGKTYTQAMAREFAKLDHLILVCGHYEGIDERVKKFIDISISIGDYILTGGEIPAMVIVDSVVRLLPGVLFKSEATKYESFSLRHSDLEQSRKGRIPFIFKKKTGSFASLRMTSLLEYPPYTRPEVFRGLKVPAVLLSGNHKKIKEWRENNIK